jgi:hypothetical protein
MTYRCAVPLVTAFIANFLLSGTVGAQMGPGPTVTDDIDYLTRQGVDERLAADDVNLLGDQIDLNTGAVVFEHTDVSLPGNSHLEVAVRRLKTLGEMRVERKTGFGVPRISRTR